MDFPHQGGIGVRVLVVQDVRHQHRIVRPTQVVSVKIAREEAEALCKPGLLDQTFGGPQRLRQVKDSRRQSRIGLAERHRVRPGTTPQIQEGPPAAEVDLLGQRRRMLQGHVRVHQDFGGLAVGL